MTRSRLKPGMLVEYLDPANVGRRGRLVRRVGRYKQWVVEITEVPATWPQYARKPIGTLTFWWESDFVVVPI